MNVIKIDLSPSEELKDRVGAMVDTVLKVLYENGRPKKKETKTVIRKVAILCITEGLTEGIETGIVAGIKAAHTKPETAH